MTRTFRPHTQRRISMFVWTLVFLLIAVAQLISQQPPLTIALFVCIAGVGSRIAWRRVTVPLYTLTDEGIRIGGVLIGYKHVRWQDIKAVEQDNHWLQLLGREWIGTTHINLHHLPQIERPEFINLVREHVDRTNANAEGTLL